MALVSLYFFLALSAEIITSGRCFVHIWPSNHRGWLLRSSYAFVKSEKAQKGRDLIQESLFVRSATMRTSLQHELSLNTEEHARECSSALKQWPTIASPECIYEQPGTTAAFHVHSSSLISPGNRPFHSRALVHTTDSRLLSADDCAAIIDEAERLGRERGWRSRYTLQVRSWPKRAAVVPPHPRQRPQPRCGAPEAP